MTSFSISLLSIELQVMKKRNTSRLIFEVQKILFLPESTEGVAVGAMTAMDYENAADSTENDTETVTK